MNIGSKFGKLSEIMKNAGPAKPQQKPSAEAPAKPKPAPAQMNPVETVTKPPKKGTAALVIDKGGDPIKAFQKAASGKKIDLPTFKNPNKTMAAFMDYASNTLNKEEMGNVFKFMGEMKRADNGALLGEAIAERGLTHEQLDMIANGEISGKEYLSMVKVGDPSS